MDHPRKRAQPAASTNRVPTIRSNPVIKRSVSSATAGIHKQIGLESTDQAQEPNKQALNYSLQMKNALTELLNHVRAKGSDQGSRCLQNILMENERESTIAEIYPISFLGDKTFESPDRVQIWGFTTMVMSLSYIVMMGGDLLQDS
ncbi:hypothetical protein BDV41DRAFT_577644 [Aspergillus transmontanensis]|uniref:Uncharacterized protein n=1 Tax=Aspergillus transmontanensis TaxID=1034304 RepID=A0A5N6VUZ6_9EURO|nr:hypothetical protein BDV41DRAFT_577644 [Aspergillus transmontanensis]